jgi:hypothetical protein
MLNNTNSTIVTIAKAPFDTRLAGGIVGVVEGIDGALSAPVFSYEVLFEEAHARAVRNDMFQKRKNSRRKVRQDTRTRAQRVQRVKRELAALARPGERKALRAKRKAAYNGLTAREAELTASLAMPEVGGELAALLREELGEVVAQRTQLGKKLGLKAK